MSNSVDFLITGGDMRMKYLEGMLTHSGYNVKSVFLDKTITELPSVSADNIILPVPCCTADSCLNAPFSDVKLSPLEVIKNVHGCRCVFGGMVPRAIKEFCEDNGIMCCDYMQQEPLTIKNAEATAEGAIKAAIENTDFTLCGGRVLVTGYGRIGKILSRYLKALGADVTVEARKAHDLAWIKANGYKALPLWELENKACEFEIIFNTVPYHIFTEREVKKMDKNVVYIELASLPGGIDEDAAKQHKIRLVKAPSLPGKTAPKTSAEAIMEAVLGILKEVEV